MDKRSGVTRVGGWVASGGVWADEYVRHYYGDAYFDFARADTLTSPGQISDHLARLSEAGATDVVLYPASADLDQVGRLADVVSSSASRSRSA